MEWERWGSVGGGGTMMAEGVEAELWCRRDGQGIGEGTGAELQSCWKGEMLGKVKLED